MLEISVNFEEFQLFLQFCTIFTGLNISTLSMLIYHIKWIDLVFPWYQKFLMHCSVQFLDSNIIVLAEASVNVTSSFRSFIVPCNSLICLFSDIVSSEGVFQVWHPVFIFRYKCCDVSSTSGLHCLGFCLLIAPRTSVHLIL